MNDFDNVKNRLSLQAVITQETGFTMKGKHLEECPFCTGHNCFAFYNDGASYKCFQCEASGDVFTFLQGYHELNANEALLRAAAIAGVEITREKQKEKAESYQERMYRLAAEHYLSQTSQISAGYKWFTETRGHSENTLYGMQVGYATDKLLPFLRKEGFTDAKILKYGLAREDKGDGIIKDYFWKGLAVFPVIDHDGKVISFTSKDPTKKYPGLMLEGIKKIWFLNFRALGKDDCIMVEGENDIASLMDIGLNNVIGTAGAPGEDQIRLLKNFSAGKTVYLWFDKDKQKNIKKRTGGAHHIEFIYKKLTGADITLKIITHPGESKDADEYIQGLLKAGESPNSVRSKIRELREKSVDPLTWELQQLAEIESSKDSLDVFTERGLSALINTIPSRAEQEILIDLAATSIGISVNAVEELVRNSTDLYKELSNKFHGAAGIKKAEPLEIAEHIFKWFNNGSGARFFKTVDGKCYVFYQRKIYLIGNNLDFNTLMQELTRLAAVERPGSTVWYFLENLCNMRGELVDMMTWLYTNREKDIIFLNLNSNHNKIIQIEPGEDPQVIDNGTNQYSVLLSSSPQIKSFNYTHNPSEAEGFAALKELLMDTTPCEGQMRYFMVCWMISAYLMNYQSDRGLLQIIASSKIGKSKVAERISQLFYGESYVGKGTGAAETRVAAANPFLFMDNVENRNLTIGTVDFLLLLANSSHKPKAKGGSDTEVLYQKLFTMAIITSIEAFPGRLPELVNRTFPLQLEPQWKLPGYMHDEVMRQIIKKRSLILSSILKMVGRKVLPNLAERSFWSKHIQTEFPGHYKDRNNEHICMMMIILESLLEHIPWKKETPIKTQASMILKHWIESWNEQESQTAVDSSTLLNVMDGLAKEVYIKIRGKGLNSITYQSHPEFEAPYPNLSGEGSYKGEGIGVYIFDDPEYMETFYLTEKMDDADSDDPDDFLEQVQRLEIIIPAADLYTLLNRYCANQHTRNPFDGPTALGARISNDKHILQKGGWDIVSKKKGQMQYKKVRGKWYWRFSKKLRPIV
ncbi:MAG: CHC2 zinc finger domain-containing protein [Thermodesulfovibrionia bacterium]|nr:CHC2 zinc finger domain-containing protein [Thermodesulfovibrionia bacterium]